MRPGISALISGFLGASASCLAKYAFDADPYFGLPPTVLDSNDNSYVSNDSLRYISELAVRGFFFACTIACNALMLGTFLDGMEESGSVAATALSTAANFSTTAAYGYVLWNERFSLQWWSGFGMVFAGVMVLSQRESVDPKKD